MRRGLQSRVSLAHLRLPRSAADGTVSQVCSLHDSLSFRLFVALIDTDCSGSELLTPLGLLRDEAAYSLALNEARMDVMERDAGLP